MFTLLLKIYHPFRNISRSIYESGRRDTLPSMVIERGEFVSNFQKSTTVSKIVPKRLRELGQEKLVSMCTRRRRTYN
jgi:hypothetical protein